MKIYLVDDLFSATTIQSCISLKTNQNRKGILQFAGFEYQAYMYITIVCLL